jgi:hypothetical protein
MPATQINIKCENNSGCFGIAPPNIPISSTIIVSDMNTKLKQNKKVAGAFMLITSQKMFPVPV